MLIEKKDTTFCTFKKITKETMINLSIKKKKLVNCSH